MYGDSAVTYADKGWQVFPLPAGQKFPPPAGRTGRDGTPLERAQIEQEALTHADGNVAVRACEGLIGIDVDAYGGKPGAETLARLIEELGDLPETVMSTSRTDGSGIRIFRVPDGVQLITKLPGIEFVQAHHRYVVAWPSVHPEGRTYRWVNSVTGEILSEIPELGSVPDLPSAWIDHLRTGSNGSHKANAVPDEIDSRVRAWCRNGEPCEHLEEVLAHAERQVQEGNARHDVCMSAQLSVIRLGEQLHPGARTALARLRGWFENAIGGERDVTKEWHDGWQGAVRVIIASPTEDGDKGCFTEAPEADADGADAGETIETDEDFGESRDGRTRINVGNRDRAGRRLRELIGTGPLAGLFHREGELVFTPRIGEQGYVPPDEGDDGPAQVRIMDPLRLKTMIEVRYAVGVGKRRSSEDGETRIEWEPKMLPGDVAAQLYTAACLRENVTALRTLVGVSHTPLVRRDGSIVHTPGYDPATKMLYLPTGEAIGDVGEVTHERVREAVTFLLRIVEEFPFVSEHHRANWYGALFSPLMRIMLPPPYPMFVMDAPSPGSGKSYLAEILRLVHGGVLRAGWPGSDEELGKSLLSVLTGTTAPVVTFDNVRGKIRSANLEGLLTSEFYTSRMLGHSRDLTMPNDRLWTVTANNAEIGGDLARRCYWITIDPGMPRPHERTGFKLNLREWVPGNQRKIIESLLIVVRGWCMAGMPSAGLKRSDHYATWDAAIEGLLSWAGFPGQFGFVEPSRKDSDDDLEWLSFLSEVHRVMGTTSFKMRDLVATIKDSDGGLFEEGEEVSPEGIFDPSCLPGELADKWCRIGMGSPASFTKSVGRWASHRSGRYAGDISLWVMKDPKRGDKYMIKLAPSQGGV